MSEREEWMSLIRNEYDPAPSHYRTGDNPHEQKVGMTMHTVAGLVRSGHIFCNVNGIYRLTEKGFHALPPGGHMQGDDQ